MHPRMWCTSPADCSVSPRKKEFLLLPFAGSDGNMLCLQSAGTPGLAFIAMNPFSLKPDYAPVLGAEELEVMEVRRSEDLCYYVMCVVRDPVGASTLNLRCPVVINPELHRGMQVILEEGGYEMRHRLDSLVQGEVS